MPQTTPVPPPDRKPAWRGCAGASHHASWVAAVEGLIAVWPIPLDDAKREATHAIAYASANHREWFWDGVGGS